MIDLRQGDCIARMKEMGDNSVDLILTDPPYHLTSITKRFGKKGSAEASTKNNDGSLSRLSKGFMGKEWDGVDENGLGIAFNVEMWQEALRVLKPGGYLMAFGGTRTYHRMACAIEDAGFEIRDTISYLYGSGFPKALDISKQLQKKDKEDLAKQYEGYKTALKPSFEPCVLAQKNLSEKNFAENVMKWGTGGLNIDKSRIGYISDKDKQRAGTHSNNGKEKGVYGDYNPVNTGHDKGQEQGRYPANTIISEDIAPILDKQSGILKSGASRFFYNAKIEEGNYTPFYYTSKCSKKERNSNIHGELVEGNNHPTTKPKSILKFLLTLGLPPYDSVVLDMFAGSGSLGLALEEINKENGTSHKAILIEMDAEHCEIIKKRCCLE